MVSLRQMEVAGLVVTLLAATPPATCQQPATIKSGTQEVLLDLVVRDKHQRMVRDLHAAEVAVYEDGVPQEIRSFEFVRGKEPTLLNGPNGKAANRFDPLHELNIIAMVFQAMSNEARLNAGIMARDFLRNEFPPNTLLGAFAVNRRLYLLQPFTNRPELLNTATETITRSNYTWFGRISAENLGSLDGHIAKPTGKGDDNTINADTVDTSQWQLLGLGDASERGPEADAAVLNLKRGIEKMETKIIRHAQGMYSTETLLALIRVMAAIPGRKTILFFSEGLSIDVDEHQLLAHIINEANRANVSFYTVNTNGMQLLGPRARMMASRDSQPLRELAESTGGFSMENSNDLRVPLQRVVEDSTSHYELFYRPTSQDFNGRFRRIEVRVDRPRVTTQTREGYYALPMLAGQLMQGFEIECLKALNDVPLPHAFPFQGEAVRFHDIGDEAQYQFVIELPSSVPRLTMESDGKSLTGSVSVMALLKDQAGNVIDKISRSAGLRIESAKVEQFQRSPMTFTLPIAAPPGRFTLEVAIVDHSSHRASTEVMPLEVATTPSPEVSDIVMVGSLERSQASGESPLTFLDQRVIPSLQRRFSAVRLKNLPIFFTVHRRAADTVPEVTLKLLHAGRVVASVTPTAQIGDTPEDMPFLASIPIDNLPRGFYDLVAEARSDAGHMQKTVRFELE